LNCSSMDAVLRILSVMATVVDHLVTFELFGTPSSTERARNWGWVSESTTMLGPPSLGTTSMITSTGLRGWVGAFLDRLAGGTRCPRTKRWDIDGSTSSIDAGRSFATSFLLFFAAGSSFAVRTDALSASASTEAAASGPTITGTGGLSMVGCVALGRRGRRFCLPCLLLWQQKRLD
jgi:hypothetical protein